MKCKVIEGAEAADKARGKAFAVLGLLTLALLCLATAQARAEPLLYAEVRALKGGAA